MPVILVVPINPNICRSYHPSSVVQLVPVICHGCHRRLVAVCGLWSSSYRVTPDGGG